jgi:hypothetical protein
MSCSPIQERKFSIGQGQDTDSEPGEPVWAASHKKKFEEKLQIQFVQEVTEIHGGRSYTLLLVILQETPSTILCNDFPHVQH